MPSRKRIRDVSGFKKERNRRQTAVRRVRLITPGEPYTDRERNDNDDRKCTRGASRVI